MVTRDFSAEKSRVTIAGINVGQIDKIELAGNRAKVWVRVTTPLRSDARIRKRQASLLGEYFLQLTPGYQGTLLEDGARIDHVEYDTPPSALLNNLKDVAQNVVDITASLKRVIADKDGERRLVNILKNFDKVAAATLSKFFRILTRRRSPSLSAMTRFKLAVMSTTF